MVLADKIIELRKRNGWSQEDLADKMGVTRQSISKWESQLSTPDLDKLIELSKLFDVSLDTLLKDDIVLEDEAISTDNMVSEEFVKSYINKKRVFGIIDAIATFLMIISPITLIILGVMADSNKLSITEDLAGIIGLIVLFILVAIGVSLYIYAYFKIKDDNETLKNGFSVPSNLKSSVEAMRKSYENTYLIKTIIGVLLCIISVIPLFIGIAFNKDITIVTGLSITLVLVAVGVFLFVDSNSYRNGLLVFTRGSIFEYEGKNKIYEAITSILWITTTAVYLVVSFITERWDITWVAFVIAAFISAIISVIFEARKKDAK